MATSTSQRKVSVWHFKKFQGAKTPLWRGTVDINTDQTWKDWLERTLFLEWSSENGKKKKKSRDPKVGIPRVYVAHIHELLDVPQIRDYLLLGQTSDYQKVTSHKFKQFYGTKKVKNQSTIGEVIHGHPESYLIHVRGGVPRSNSVMCEMSQSNKKIKPIAPEAKMNQTSAEYETLVVSQWSKLPRLQWGADPDAIDGLDSLKGPSTNGRNEQGALRQSEALKAIGQFCTDDGKYVGTGFWITSKHVATAHHVLQNTPTCFRTIGTQSYTFIQKYPTDLTSKPEYNLDFAIVEIVEGVASAMIPLWRTKDGIPYGEGEIEWDWYDTKLPISERAETPIVSFRLKDGVSEEGALFSDYEPQLYQGYLMGNIAYDVYYSHTTSSAMSGSPLLSNKGNLLGFHRAGGSAGRTSDEKDAFYNIGVRVDLVVRRIFNPDGSRITIKKQVGDDCDKLKTVLMI